MSRSLEIDGQPHVLPIAEIGFVGFPPDKPKIVGYAAKWDVDAPEYHATPRIFPDLPESSVTRCPAGPASAGIASDYAATPGLTSASTRRATPWVLEVNANPCLSRDAGFAAAANRPV